jgi:lysozyme family protein
MKANFQPALAAVLKHEGGYVNHPKDPGGETNKGVTKAVYDEYRDRNKLPRRSVKYIADHELQAIYRTGYWYEIRGDDLPSGVDYCVFDFAVNSGPSRAAKYLQTAIGVVPDGQIGPITLAAVQNADPKTVINAICNARMDFLEGLPTWGTFGKGWTSRVSGVRKMALELSGNSGVLPPPPDIEPPGDHLPDAPKVDIPPPVNPAGAIAAAVLAVVGAVIGAVMWFIGFGGN